MKRSWSTSRAVLLAAALALCAPIGCWAGSPRSNAAETPETFHGRVPLGIDGFFLRHARRTLYLLGTANSSIFEGWRVVEMGEKRALKAADGSTVKFYPRTVRFRVTATTLLEPLLEVDRDFLDLNNADLNRYLLALSFRLKIFHGLQVTTLEPDNVEMIGMPADVPYEERVYRTSFTLPPVPIEDRLVLEVLRPDGERLCKFHLEF